MSARDDYVKPMGGNDQWEAMCDEIDRLRAEVVSIEQLVATYNAVWSESANYAHEDMAAVIAWLRSVKP